MKITVTKSDLASLETISSCAAVQSLASLKKSQAGRLARALGLDLQVLKDFKAEPGEVVVLYGDGWNVFRSSRIALLGTWRGKIP